MNPVDDKIPIQSPSNYPWYVDKMNLSNFLGYELHLCTPSSYLKIMPYFYNINIDYISEKKIDFIILNKNLWNDHNFLEKYSSRMDKDKYVDLDHNLAIYRFRNTVSDHWHKLGQQVYNENYLDNGYFYSPTLMNEAIESFKTNRANHFLIVINSDKNTEVAFSLYPNKNYHYYVNSKEINPKIEELNIYIPVSQGKNEIKIVYKNYLVYICLFSFLLFYLLILSYPIFCLISKFYFNNKKSLSKD